MILFSQKKKRKKGKKTINVQLNPKLTNSRISINNELFTIGKRSQNAVAFAIDDFTIRVRHEDVR